MEASKEEYSGTCKFMIRKKSREGPLGLLNTYQGPHLSIRIRTSVEPRLEYDEEDRKCQRIKKDSNHKAPT